MCFELVSLVVLPAAGAFITSSEDTVVSKDALNLAV